MSLEFIGLVAVVLGLVSIRRSESFVISVFVASTLLGSAAALTITAVGASIQPAHVLLGFLVLKILGNRAGFHRAGRVVAFPREGYWLLCAVLYGTAGAMFFPRIMAGQMYVNGIGVGSYGPSSGQVPFGPTSGNITQSVYFIGDAFCFVACSVYAARPNGIITLAQAFLAYCFANIVFAALDLATFWSGTGFLLDFLRNASYAIYTDTMVGSLKRIIGSFTEASSFAYASMGAVAFSFRLWLDGIWRRLTLPVALISLTLLLLSTSSTAYVALPVYAAAVYLRLLLQLLRGRAPTVEAVTVMLLPLILILGIASLMLIPAVWNVVADFFDIMVLQKSSSGSGVERGRFNAEAFTNFLETLGLGTGIGSVRASSFVLAVLANLGVPGGLAYAAFLAFVTTKPLPPDMPAGERSVIKAARATCIALMMTSSISGALIDLGLPFFICAALASAATVRADRRFGWGRERMAPRG